MKSGAAIYYIADIELPSQKANAVNTVKMCEALALLGHPVTLVFPVISNKVTSGDFIRDFYAVETPFVIKPIRVPNFPGVLLLFAARIIAFLWTKKSKHVFIYGRSPFSLAALSALGFRVGMDVHGQIWKNGIARYWAFRVLLWFKTTRVITFNTPELLEIFKNQFHSSMKAGPKLSAMANGATLLKVKAPFSFQDQQANLRVGYLGSFLEGRGIDVLLMLAVEMPTFTFHLAGGNHADITKLKVRHALPGNVYLYGHIPFKETYAFRAGCDILVAPYQANVKVPSGENTLQYMSPIKLFEYMASQRPIICSDFPVIRGVLSNENAILVKADSLVEWKAALVRLQDVQERQKIADNAFQQFMHQYTWENRAQKLLLLIEEL